MKENHDIDRLFQESFKDFEVEAPKNAWANIEKELKSSRKKVLPLWQKISAAAAVIAVLILAGSQWLIGVNTDNKFTPVVNSTNEILSQPREPSDENENTLITAIEGDDEGNESKNNLTDEKNTGTNVNSVNTQANYLSISGSVANAKYSKKTKKILRGETQSAFAQTQKDISEDSEVIALLSKPVFNGNNFLKDSEIELSNKNDGSNAKLQSLVEVAQKIYQENQNSSSPTEQKSWFVKPQISPTFYGNMGSGSAIDENLAQNSGSGDVNVSFGVNIAYQLNDKVKIRSGINRVNLNYSTNDVFVVPGTTYSSFNNVDISSSYQASILTQQQIIDLNNDGVLGRIPTETSQLQQQLGFIEIPMELEYKLLDKDININIIGGASTLLLNQNSLDIKTGNSTTSVGEANNLNDISFSTNFALGFDYDISERLMLNLEPTFKYQINTFQSGTTDFQPYFFGIYSGLVFKF